MPHKICKYIASTLIFAALFCGCKSNTQEKAAEPKRSAVTQFGKDVELARGVSDKQEERDRQVAEQAKQLDDE